MTGSNASFNTLCWTHSKEEKERIESRFLTDEI